MLTPQQPNPFSLKFHFSQCCFYTATLCHFHSSHCILCDQELRIRDDSYVKELKGQEEELALLIERMEDQIKTMTKAYREELAQLEVGLGGDGKLD